MRSWPQFLLRDLGVVSAEKAARGARPYADYQSGLLFEDGTPKPAATSFKLALFVDCVTTRPARPARKRRGKRRGKRRSGKHKRGARTKSRRGRKMQKRVRGRSAAKRRSSKRRSKKGRKRRSAKRSRTERRLVIWGHVRPGSAAHRVILEQRVGAAPVWTQAATASSARARKRASYSRQAFATSASGVFVRHAPLRRGVSYRLRLPETGESGLPVSPVPCGRKPETVARNDGEY